MTHAVPVRAAAQANLVVTSLTLSAPSAFPGNVVEVHWKTKNIGTAASNVRDTQDSVRLCAGVRESTCGPVIGRGDVYDQMEPGWERLFETRITVPPTPDGTYYVSIEADHTGKVAESSEADNLRMRALAIGSQMDLVPLAIGRPSHGISGQPVTLSWAVENQGTVWTRSHLDRLLLCTSTSTSSCVATLNVFAAPEAGPDRWYGREQISVRLPTVDPGTYRLLLQVDATNAVDEYDETDNLLAVPFEIRSPLSPDLIPTALEVQRTGTHGEQIAVRWTVINQGRQAAAAHRDTIAFCEPSGWTSCTYRPLVSEPVVTSTPAGGNYTRSATFRVPDDARLIDHRLAVLVDEGRAVAELLEGNNSHDVRFDVIRPGPDLFLSSIRPAVRSAAAGDTVRLDWTVTNGGSITAPGHADRVSLCSAGGCTALATRAYAHETRRDGSYAASVQVTIPERPVGAYTFRVETDAATEVSESNENNNIGIAEFDIDPLKPDLTVATLTVGRRHALPTQVLTATYTVRNEGRSPAAPHADRFELCRNTTPGQWTQTLVCNEYAGLATANIATTTYPEGTYTRSVSFELPNAAPGDYLVRVRTDAAAAVAEADEGNNARAVPLYIDPADLVPTALTASPGTGTTDDPLTITLSVANQGTGPAAPHEITFLLCRTTSRASCSYNLGSREVTTPTGAGATYTRTLAIPYPNVPTGDYYVYAAVDDNGGFGGPAAAFETSEANNVRTTRIHVDQKPAPNLVPVRLVLSSTSAVQGEIVTVTATVRNIGTVAAELHSDYIFVCPTATPRNCAGNGPGYTHEEPVAPGASYTWTGTFETPFATPGAYRAILETDTYQFLAESNEDDNLLSVPFSITSEPMANLVTTVVSAQASARPGDRVPVTWTVRNDGTSAAGAHVDRVYWCTGTAGGTCTATNHVAASIGTTTAVGASYTKTASVVVPAGYDGSYYLYVSADNDDQIAESSEQDNQRTRGITIGDFPTVTIADRSVSEGDSGQTQLTFTVRLSKPWNQLVTVKRATANGTASAPGDYAAIALGTIGFQPGETSKPIHVFVNGDSAVEANEQLFVDLSAAVNAVISDARGVGSILNDD